MRALRLYAERDLRLEHVPEPVPAYGEVAIRVEAAGICGTDRHLFLGEFPARVPVTLGHEFSGIITSVGDGVDLTVGSRVTCDPNTSCLTCTACLKGRVNLCSRNVATGIHRDGGFAPFAIFPSSKAIALPATMNPLHGAFAEPLACTLHGLDMAAIQPGERCLIMGGGVIGLMALQLARLAGADTMMLTRSREKQGLALQLGAMHIAKTATDALSIWRNGADVVLECAGVSETVEVAPSLTANGGRIVVLGVMPQSKKIQIEPFDLLFREIQLQFSFLNPFTQGRAAALIASGKIDVAPLISRVITLDEAIKTISFPAAPADIRAIVIPD